VRAAQGAPFAPVIRAPSNSERGSDRVGLGPGGARSRVVRPQARVAVRHLLPGRSADLESWCGAGNTRSRCTFVTPPVNHAFPTCRRALPSWGHARHSPRRPSRDHRFVAPRRIRHRARCTPAPCRRPPVAVVDAVGDPAGTRLSELRRWWRGSRGIRPPACTPGGPAPAARGGANRRSEPACTRGSTCNQTWRPAPHRARYLSAAEPWPRRSPRLEPIIATQPTIGMRIPRSAPTATSPESDEQHRRTHRQVLEVALHGRSPCLDLLARVSSLLLRRVGV
jgi:hypothetical protein